MASMIRSLIPQPSFDAGWQRWVALALVPPAILLGVLMGTVENRFAVLLVAAMAGFVLLVLTIRYERLPFYLLVATLPLEASFRLSGVPNPLLLAFGGLAIINLLWRMAFGRRKFIYDGLSTLLALALVTWAALSAYNAGGAAAVMTDARSYVLILVLFLLTQNYLREEKHFWEAGWVLAVSLALAGTAVLVNVGGAYILSGGTLSGKALHRLADNLFFNTPAGVLGMQISKGIPFAIYLAILTPHRQKLRRNLLWLMVIAMTAGTLATLSLNAALGLLTTYAMLALFVRQRSRQMNAALLSAVILGTVVLSPISPFADRIEKQLDFVDSGETYRVGSNRVLAWYIGIQTTLEAPLLGLGPGQEALLEASQAYIPLRLYQRKLDAGREIAGLHPHNFYLSTSAMLGIPGLLLYLGFLAAVIVRTWRLVLRSRQRLPTDPFFYMGQAIVAALIALLVQAFGLSIPVDKYLWLLLGMGAAYLTVTGKRPT